MGRPHWISVPGQKHTIAPCAPQRPTSNDVKKTPPKLAKSFGNVNSKRYGLRAYGVPSGPSIAATAFASTKIGHGL